MADTETTAPIQKVPHRFKWGRLFRYLILLIIVIIAAVLLAHRLHIGQKVYAEADGHTIYKKDIDTIEKTGSGLKNPEISDHMAATVLADKYLTQAMAKQQDVQITNTDMAKFYGKDFPNRKAYDPYGYQNLLNQLYLTKLDQHGQGVYSGKLLIAMFDRYLAYQSALLPKQKAANPLLGDQAAIAKDKQYAQTFITNLYNQIKSGKMTFDQAIQAEHNDPQLGESEYPTQLHSQSFDSRTLSQIPQLNVKSAVDRIKSLEPGQITPPFVVSISDSESDPKSTSEAYYLVVQIDKASGGGSKLNIQQQVTQAKKQLGYKINV